MWLRFAAALVAFGAIAVGIRFFATGGLLSAALVAGGAIYLTGLAEFDTESAERRRRAGFWICLVAVAIPSTLTLVLPITALLLFAIPSRQEQAPRLLGWPGVARPQK